MEDSTPGWTQLGPFFSKIRALFWIFKKGQGRPLTSHLLNVEALRGSAYQSAALKKARCLFQKKNGYSHEI